MKPRHDYYLSIGICFLALLAIILVSASYYITAAPALSLAVCLTLTFIVSAYNIKLLGTKKFQIIYLAAFFLKFALLLYQTVNKNLPLGGIDWSRYSSNAAKISEQSSSIVQVFTSSSTELFTKLVAAIYYCFGTNPEQIYFYVFLSSIITFTFIYLAALEITNDSRKSQITALLFMFWPVEIIHSITFLRELPIQCFFIISVYHFIRFVKFGGGWRLVLALLFIAIATMMHSGMIGILFVYLFVAAQYRRKRGVVFNPIGIVLFVVAVTLLVNSSLWSSLTGKFAGIDSADDIVAQKQAIRGNTTYISAVPKSVTDLVKSTPYLTVMFALSPFPWQVYNLSTLIAWLIDGLARLWIISRLVIYFARSVPDNPHDNALQKTFLMLVIITYLIFALGTQNYGTAMRHRSKTFPLEIILAYPCVELYRQKKKRNDRRIAQGVDMSKIDVSIGSC